MGFNGYITNNTGGRDQQRLRSKSLLVDVGFFLGGLRLRLPLILIGAYHSP
jgi:hypothetical protein